MQMKKGFVGEGAGFARVLLAGGGRVLRNAEVDAFFNLNLISFNQRDVDNMRLGSYQRSHH